MAKNGWMSRKKLAIVLGKKQPRAQIFHHLFESRNKIPFLDKAIVFDINCVKALAYWIHTKTLQLSDLASSATKESPFDIVL